MPEFEWNDETVRNSYGFRVRNSGIALQRFTANPVMQNSHENTTEANLGKWEKWRTQGAKLFGTTVFDNTRDVVKEVEGQVERGFIRGCSMGLAVAWDDDSWQIAPDGTWELVKCELTEVSICAVPANASSLALYDKATGDLIPEDQIKAGVLKLSAKSLDTINTPNMDKIILSTAALSVMVGLNMSTENVTPAQISEAFVKLNAELTASQTKVTELAGKLETQVKLQAEALIDQAILEEKLTAAEKEDYLKDAIANYALTAKLIGKMPGKVSLSNRVVNQDAADAAKFKTLADFQKAPVSEQLAFKKENPAEYKALFAK